jgi:hypothetical protein
MLEIRVNSSKSSFFHKNGNKFTQNKGFHFIKTLIKQMFRINEGTRALNSTYAQDIHRYSRVVKVS